jgi:hypothetical protein
MNMRKITVNRDKTWQATAGLPQCVTNDARFDSKIDPDDVKILNISETKLDERLRESRTRITIIYDKWTRSGNNDADSFYSFCYGDKSAAANLFRLGNRTKVFLPTKAQLGSKCTTHQDLR